MDFKIDKISESDFEALFALFQEFASFENLPDSVTNSVEQMKREKEYLKGFTAKDENGAIVGYVTYFFTYHTWTGKCLYMDDLYIREQYRGKGLGTLLINKVIEFAKESKCNKMRWQVSNWNDPAIAFYENLGAEINRVDMNCDLIL